MIDILIVGKDSAYGLTKDGTLLAEALRAVAPGLAVEQADHRSRGFLERLRRRRRARIVIHIERVFTRWLGAAQQHYVIPNQERFPRRHVWRLRLVDGVLAKSRHAEAIFAGRGAVVRHLGFRSEDRLDPGVERDWGAVLHLAGASTLKGTEDVLAAWAAHPEWPRLVLVQKAHLAPAAVPANVELVTRYMDDGEIRQLQNRCGIHLCPSRAEGWGHHLVEAMSVGALIVTTDAPPMNEHLDSESALLVSVARARPRRVGTSFFVGSAALEGAVGEALAMPDERKARLGTAARTRFEGLGRDFHDRLAAFVASTATGGLEGGAKDGQRAA